MLSGISITCFAASYAVTLVLEASRLFFRLPVRWIVMILFAAAGLFAHTVYLSTLTRQELQSHERDAVGHVVRLVSRGRLGLGGQLSRTGRPAPGQHGRDLPAAPGAGPARCGPCGAATAAVCPRAGVELLGLPARHRC